MFPNIEPTNYKSPTNVGNAFWGGLVLFFVFVMNQIRSQISDYTLNRDTGLELYDKREVCDWFGAPTEVQIIKPATSHQHGP